eukprot:1887274-Rhodomonas_salina.2
MAVIRSLVIFMYLLVHTQPAPRAGSGARSRSIIAQATSAWRHSSPAPPASTCIAPCAHARNRSVLVFARLCMATASESWEGLTFAMNTGLDPILALRCPRLCQTQQPSPCICSASETVSPLINTAPDMLGTLPPQQRFLDDIQLHTF